MAGNMGNTMGTHKKIAAIFLAGVVITAILAVLHKDTLNREPSRNTAEKSRSYRTVEKDGKKYRYNTDLMTVLCIGVDAENLDTGGQADVINLIVLDRKCEKMKIIALSRDSIVTLQVLDPSGKKVGQTKDHLALSYSYGKDAAQGSLLTAEAVSSLFHDIPVVYYASGCLTSIGKFQELVGTLEVQIPGEDLEYLGDEYKKGNMLTLDAGNVEVFLRNRNTEENFSNSGRMMRQKVYVSAYIEKLKMLLQTDFSGTLDSMTAVLAGLAANISLEETEAFAQMFMTYQCDPQTDYHVVEGKQQEGVFHDDFMIDENALSQLILDIFYNEEDS